MTIESFLKGYPPGLVVGAGNPEAQKYGRMWAEIPAYRVVSPGEQLVPIFLAQARPRRGVDVIDFGCGTGRGALALMRLGGLRVTMVDFVRNCLDSEAQEALTRDPEALRFVKHDLEQPLPFAAPYGFCCDVMEHIPEVRVGQVLRNILMAAQHVFVAISTVDDVCGAAIGERLHMTVHPYAWWLWQFSRHDCVIHWSQDLGETCLFYVSAWQGGPAVVEAGVLNVEERQIVEHVRHNTAQGWAQVIPHETNDVDLMILGGGPSMAALEEEIAAHRAAGVKLVTLNGAYAWALEHGLTPSAQIVVDARPFNARFTRPVVDGCKYLIASQVDPPVFEGLPRDRTLIWHTTAGLIEDILTAHYPGGWWAVPGGSTVLLRAIPLLRMLGFRRFHLYGCDSCLSGDAHHAYAQPENDAPVVFPVTCGDRVFSCAPWMAAQAQEFIDLIRFLGDEIELEVHGDGLLAHILATGARLDDARQGVAC